MAVKKRTKRSSLKRTNSVSGTKRHTYTPRRKSSRGRVGALSSTTELLLGSIAGAFASRTIAANMRPPMDPNDTDLRNYVGIVVGGALMYVGKNNKLLEGAALGAIAESATTLISNNWIPMFGGGAQMGAGLRYGVVNGGLRHGVVNGRRPNRRMLNGVQGGRPQNQPTLQAANNAARYNYDGY